MDWETPAMIHMEYMRTGLGKVERYPPDKAAVIVSLDRRLKEHILWEVGGDYEGVEGGRAEGG
jgi:hypothetical protein